MFGGYDYAIVCKSYGCTHIKNTPGGVLYSQTTGETIIETNPEDYKKRIERSQNTDTPLENEVALMYQLIAEIGTLRTKILKDNNHIRTTTDKPRRYYYLEHINRQEMEQLEAKIKISNRKKQSLHKKICDFLYHVLNVYPKQIDFTTNKGQYINKWLNPDIIGLCYLTEKWDFDIVKYSTLREVKQLSLLSLAIFNKINFTNIREAFFQTLSNSGWANQTYMFALEIDESVVGELYALCIQHQVGVVLLDQDNPTESRILVPAPEKMELDWNMMNKIAVENLNFKEFIHQMSDFIQNGRIKPRDWNF